MLETNTISLSVRVDTVQDLIFDPEEGLNIEFSVSGEGDDTDAIITVSLEHLVEELSDELRDAQDSSFLHCVAHELNRLSEIIRERALYMEESVEKIGYLYSHNLTTLLDTDEGLPE